MHKMPGSSSTSYDAVIIGAGISGLVCGCYLAKAGMKVLIVEQHNKPGGYCSSFKRFGFTFDAAAHSIGGCKHGIMGRVFQDLDLERRLKLLRYDPSNVITASDLKVSFWAKIDDTIKEFQKVFPEERDNIKKFIHFLINPDPKSLLMMRKLTFSDLLDQFFSSDRLKAIFPVPLGGYTALPASRVSAFLGLGIFKESILDGGYYPEGGMQALSNAMAETFQEHGGELRLSCLVERIAVVNHMVTGVVLGNDGFVPSRYVISACDARQTFFNLLGDAAVKKEFLNDLDNLVPSSSMFIIYLGMNESFNKELEPRANLWYLLHNGKEDEYFSVRNPTFDRMQEYLMHVSPDKRSMVALRFAPYNDKQYWEENKALWMESFIETIEREHIPGLSKHIIHKEAATPHTLYRYTLNYHGAAFGWAGTLSQLTVPGLRKPPFLRGLFMTGHWTTHGLGVPGVTYVGYDTAKRILRIN